MEAPSAGLQPSKSPHTVTDSEVVCGSTDYTRYEQASLLNKQCIQEAEAALGNRGVIISTLREHIQKLEELYKKVIYQSEENRLKYWLAIQELESCRKFQKLCSSKENNSSRYCSKEITVNLCSSNHKQSGEKLVLPHHHEILNTDGISTIKGDQYVLIKKALSAQDFKLQFTVEKHTTDSCSCNYQESKLTSRSEAVNEHPAFVDANNIIIEKLKNENASLKQEIVALKQQLLSFNIRTITTNKTTITEVQNNLTVANKKNSGENTHIGNITPIEMRYNALAVENKKLKQDLMKALDLLQSQQREMESIKEETMLMLVADVIENGDSDDTLKNSEKPPQLDNDDETKSVVSTEEHGERFGDESSFSLDPYYQERLEEMYQQNKVNSKLINEIFWQLHQIQENTQSMRKLLETRSKTEPVEEKAVRRSVQKGYNHCEAKNMSVINTKKNVEDSLVELLIGRDQKSKTDVKSKSDVATNCFMFCGCEAQCIKDNNRKVSNPSGFYSLRSTEIKEENLDISAMETDASSVTSEPVEYYYVDPVLADRRSRIPCCGKCHLN